MKNLVTFIIITFVLGITVNGFSYDNQKTVVTGDAYFDMATGHKYIKNSDNTYTEYTRKGEEFNTSVTATQPHLSASKYIASISEESYMVYKKYSNYKPVFEIFKTTNPHPADTQAIQMLFSARQLIKHGIRLGNVGSMLSVDLNKNKTMATEAAYIDMVTGHTYIKNSDNTYTEYSLNGELFKTNVPGTQPHLSSSKYIRTISKGDLVYSKYEENQPITQILASKTLHLEK